MQIELKDKTEGYITGKEYINVYYNTLSPNLIALSALIKNRKAPYPDNNFTYFELGCGRGISSNVLAACNPNGTFFANDFNSKQIAEARNFAKQMNINNVTFLDSSFEELLNSELPPLDYISMHGVWTWVNEDNRKHIIKFIEKNLKKNGLVYINYNVLAGSASFSPVQKLMKEIFDRTNGDIEDRAKLSINFVSNISKSNSPFFSNHPKSIEQIEHYKSKEPSYILHELLNSNWDLFHHVDIDNVFVPLGLQYAGSPEMKWNILEYRVPADFMHMVKSIGDNRIRETTIELLTGLKYRIDVFSRNSEILNDQDFLNTFSNLNFALITPLNDCRMEVKMPAGKIQLDASIYNPILNELSERPKVVSQLTKNLNRNAVEVITSLLHLIAAGYVAPALSENGLLERKARTTEFNKKWVKIDHDKDTWYLASPVLGSFAAINPMNYIFLAAELIGEKPIEWGFNNLKKRGIFMRRKETNEVINDVNEVRKELQDRYEQYIGQERTLYKGLGILDG